MKGGIYLWICIAIALAGSLHLSRIDYSHALDTDVTNMLPRNESPKTRILRSLINEKQGRLVYFALQAPGLADDRFDEASESMLQLLRRSPILAQAHSLQEDTAVAPYRYVSENKLRLLFPKWLASVKSEYTSGDFAGISFEEWASRRAVEDFDQFLESPAAMEMATPELLDPLLLTINALQELAAGSEQRPMADSASGFAYYWAELAASPLAPENQEALVNLVDQMRTELATIAPEATFKYGGLARLAAASRDRIQTDIAKINILSLVVVALISIFLIRPPWRFLYALPVVLLAFVGAASVTLLVFETVNIIVLIIGSILMGTAIDYAFHALFAKPAEAQFPTRKLLLFACLSTVVGFGILLGSEMLLIRQIGVFVASGLFSAFLGSQALFACTKPSPTPEFINRIRMPKTLGILALAGVALLTLGRIISSDGVFWHDDIRNLEAPDPEVVAEDLALRSAFGSGTTRELALSIGDSFAKALENQSRFIDSLGGASVVSGMVIPSRVLPTASDIQMTIHERPRLDALFESLEEAFCEAGYESATFADFFADADAFARSLDTSAFEQALAGFAKTLKGPMAGFLDSDGTHYWSVVSLALPADRIDAAVAEVEGSVRLSQLSMLNESLDKIRERMAVFGAIGMAIIAVGILFAFGTRYGLLVVSIPLFSGCFAVAVSSFVSNELNLFHLVGCFLGGAIALDYALFGVEAMKRGEGVPYSVWLSSATTGGSFLVLTTSYIEAVRSLGMMVSIITFATISILMCLRALRANGDSERYSHRSVGARR